jgi:hypothetical protein
MKPTSVRKPDVESTPRRTLDSDSSVPPIPVGTKIRLYPGSSSVQYVTSSDYFYVDHGFDSSGHWSSYTADAQNAFLDPEETNFTLRTNAPNFQNPPLTHYTNYDNATDTMSTWFFFQFHPGDLAPETYSFTGTWSCVAAASPPNYTAQYLQNTITLVVGLDVAVGVNVTVDAASDLKLTFSDVTAAGNATAYKTSAVEAPVLANLVGHLYDVRVTASYSGNVTVSLAYDDANMTLERENSLQVVQYAPIAGDIVNYGQVNILDISFIATRFGTTPASPNWNAAADINADGKIDILDISTCAVNYGKTSQWTNITTHVDIQNNLVYGETSHFSIIGIH